MLKTVALTYFFVFPEISLVPRTGFIVEKSWFVYLTFFYESSKSKAINYDLVERFSMR